LGARQRRAVTTVAGRDQPRASRTAGHAEPGLPPIRPPLAADTGLASRRGLAPDGRVRQSRLLMTAPHGPRRLSRSQAHQYAGEQRRARAAGCELAAVEQLTDIRFRAEVLGDDIAATGYGATIEDAVTQAQRRFASLLENRAFEDLVHELDRRLRAAVPGALRLERDGTEATWIGAAARVGVTLAAGGVDGWLGTERDVVRSFYEPRSADLIDRLATGFAAALEGPGEA
jgi:hypothetical protein